MHKSLRCVLVGWLAAALLMGGCGTRERPARHRIVVIPKGTTHAFWQAIHAGAVKAAQERGDVEIIWEGPAREDQRQEQQNIVERFTSEGVSAIVLAPCDRQTLVAPVAAALKKGIPVVIIDSGLEDAPAITDSEKYLGYIATDNTEGGKKAGERMRDLLTGKERATVLMMRYQAGSESTEQREAGFEKQLQLDPRLKLVIAEDFAGATVDSAQKAAERVLANFPDLDGIFTPNESSTTGLLQALHSVKRLGQVKVVGFDGSEILVGALRAGDIHGLVLQDAFAMGYQGVLRAVDAVEGKKPAERVRHTSLRVATRENLDDPAVRALYAPDLERYLKQ
jgi:ribose transport system substrate-binding protein